MHEQDFRPTDGLKGFAIREAIRASLLKHPGRLDTPAVAFGMAIGFVSIGAGGVIRVSRFD